MNSKLLIGIIFALLMFVVIFFSSTIMRATGLEGFEVMPDSDEDMLNYKF